MLQALRRSRILVSSAERSTKSAFRCTTTSSAQSSVPIVPAFCAGTLAGVLGSLAGMGGGFVMIPLMTSSWIKLSQHQAHGTSLFAVAATGCAGAFSMQEHVQWKDAAVIAVSGMVTARLGAKVTNLLSERTLTRVLGANMIVMGPAVPLKAYIIENFATKDSSVAEGIEGSCGDERPWWQQVAGPSAIGLVSGFMAGLFGVGGGTIVVPALTVATSCTHYQALATSLAAMTLPALTGTWAHHRAGNLALRVAPTLAAGAFCGAYLGGRFGLNIDEQTLRCGFAALLVALGTRTLLKA